MDGTLTLEEIGNALTGTPALACLGVLVIVAVLIAPLLLSLAGLTGAQIVKLLRETMKFVMDVVRAFRRSNGQNGAK